MGIKESYEEAQKELNAFTQKVMAEFQEQGVQVDPSSYRDHCFRVFVLGKLQRLEDEIFNAKEVTETKETTDDKATKKPRSKKRSAPSGQLEFGV